jgi:hypothetical protein
VEFQTATIFGNDIIRVTASKQNFIGGFCQSNLRHPLHDSPPRMSAAALVVHAAMPFNGMARLQQSSL